MSFLRNAWYAAVWSADLCAGKLLPRTIVGEPLVIYRRDDGQAAVLFDACPHRFAPLHVGKLMPGDRIRCAYHGLQFDATGACVDNPHGNHRIPANCKVRSYPVAERHSMVWVWMGEQQPDEALIPDYSFLDEGSGYQISKRDNVTMKANFRLVMNNLLDLSHAPLLHEGILGHEDSIPAEIRVTQEGDYVYVERRMNSVRPGLLTDLLFKRDGKPIDTSVKMRWSAPCNLLNESMSWEAGGNPEEGAGLFGAHILTPVDEGTTRYHFAAARKGKPIVGDEELVASIKQQMSDLRRVAFEEQDEPMIEAQQRFLDVFPDAKPLLLEIDAAPVRCNRILDSLIARELAVMSQ